MAKKPSDDLFWVTWWTAAVVLAIIAVFLFASRPARSEPVADVGIYALAVACSEDLLLCSCLMMTRHNTMEGCRARVREIHSRRYQERYGVPDRPIIMGYCRSWSPPIDWRVQ